MSTLHFCTYFDHRYLPRALALYRSLERHAGDFVLWALCLSPECETLVAKLSLPRLRAVPLPALEAADPALAACRPSRSPIEYYFTCSPCLPHHLLERDGTIDTIVYLDSDLYFFGDPRLVLAHLGDAAVGITPHRLAPRVPRKFARYGRYNVGWLSFRRTPEGRACLAWWREQCLAWCFDRVEGDRYADQKYLEQFEHRFSGVRSIDLKGANLAPWNVAQYELAARDGAVRVDAEPLVFFHFQGVAAVRPGVYDSNLHSYRAPLTPALRELVYQPYLLELARCEREVAALGGSAGASLRRPSSIPGRVRHALGRWASAAIATARGTRVEL
jgi:hypothetical protein